MRPSSSVISVLTVLGLGDVALLANRTFPACIPRIMDGSFGDKERDSKQGSNLLL